MPNQLQPTTQTMSNPGKGRSRHTHELEQAQSGQPASTFQSSFQPHHVTREAERGEYLKNKGRNGKGGDWWGHVETKFETSSCYNDSFKEHNYKLLRSITYADPKSKPAPTAPSQSSDAASQQEFDKVFQKQWSKYRMRKPPKDDFGTHYDILTGTGRELGQAPPGVHIPGRRAGRVSIDKLNALKYGSEGGEHKRNYNIISNAPLSAALKE
ncbi:UNVERIFIED_CONTAM: hypothetical protein HDU68_001254 [Siphonaria sp. JEL0065]|nr:hypothetical protein HDU68_001254 [Siphonaria sp. JEL0065]